MKYTIKFLDDYLTFEEEDLRSDDCFIVSLFKTIIGCIIAAFLGFFTAIFPLILVYLFLLLL